MVIQTMVQGTTVLRPSAVVSERELKAVWDA